MEKVLYDGSPASVEKIMKLVGTMGVNNTSEKCYLPHGWVEKGEYVGREGNLMVVISPDNEFINLDQRSV